MHFKHWKTAVSVHIRVQWKNHKLNTNCNAQYSTIPAYMNQTHQSYVPLFPGVEHAELFAGFFSAVPGGHLSVITWCVQYLFVLSHVR